MKCGNTILDIEISHIFELLKMEFAQDAKSFVGYAKNEAETSDFDKLR